MSQSSSSVSYTSGSPDAKTTASSTSSSSSVDDDFNNPNTYLMSSTNVHTFVHFFHAGEWCGQQQLSAEQWRVLVQRFTSDPEVHSMLDAQKQLTRRVYESEADRQVVFAQYRQDWHPLFKKMCVELAKESRGDHASLPLCMPRSLCPLHSGPQAAFESLVGRIETAQDRDRLRGYSSRVSIDQMKQLIRQLVADGTWPRWIDRHEAPRNNFFDPDDPGLQPAQPPIDPAEDMYQEGLLKILNDFVAALNVPEPRSDSQETVDLPQSQSDIPTQPMAENAGDGKEKKETEEQLIARLGFSVHPMAAIVAERAVRVAHRFQRHELEMLAKLFQQDKYCVLPFRPDCPFTFPERCPSMPIARGLIEDIFETTMTFLAAKAMIIGETKVSATPLVWARCLLSDGIVFTTACKSNRSLHCEHSAMDFVMCLGKTAGHARLVVGIDDKKAPITEEEANWWACGAAACPLCPTPVPDSRIKEIKESFDYDVVFLYAITHVA
jgi:hypothetical protein